MKTFEKKPFILVDGSSYLYRAFHAMPSLTTSKGQATGAIYGVVNMLRKLMNDYQPEFMAVVFDAKGKTFRDDLYPDYKAHRPSMPDDLQSQIEPLHHIITAMGIPLLMIEGVEADDVIGTLARQASKAHMETLISTGDKDMIQLVNDHVTLVNTMTNAMLDPNGVKEKLGITPEQMIDYLTLIGDSIDNIPGVPNVGPKTAVKWLTQYGSLDNLISHAEEISGKVGENLRQAITHIPLSRALVTIKQDVPLHLSPTELQLTSSDKEELITLFKQVEFKSWLRELLGENQTTETHIVENTREVNYQTLLTQEACDAWLKRLFAAEQFAFDTETTSLDVMSAELVGMSFAINTGEAAYLPLAHDYEGAPPQLDRKKILQAFKPLLENPHKKKIGQNLKFDKNVLANYDINLEGIVYDTMIESYVLDSTATRHDMDSLALKYLGHRTIGFEEIAGKGAKQITFNKIPLEKASPYAAEDADVTLSLHETLWPKIQTQPGLVYVFNEIEIPLIPVLARIERHGVLIDANMLSAQSKALEKRLAVLETSAYEMAGQNFNLNSPKQLQEILFQKMGLPVFQKTPTGQASTSEDVLQDLAHHYPLPKVILEYRSLNKLKSTYVDRLPEQIHSKTGRVHTSFHQAVAATGRLSSSDPNLQNIPTRTEEGKKIRQAFIVPPGYKMISADYSQIELRIMAHFSGDPGLLNAFAQNMDIHRATAAEVFGISFNDVTEEQRRSAKAINFGLIYGMSAFGLSKQLSISRDAAEQYIQVYFARYPKVKEYMETTRQRAHEQGYVETFFGRRLYLPEINSRNIQRQRGAERAAINGPLQGTAADIIKRAMITMDRFILETSSPLRMILQVHDELVFEVPEQDVDQVIPHIKNSMVHAADLLTPLVVDVGVGDNWDEAH